MAKGVIPSPEFNRQIRRVVSEQLRTMPFSLQTQNKWHNSPEGAAGEGDGAACCQAEPIFDMLINNTLPASGARTWHNACGASKLHPVRFYFPGYADSNLPGGNTSPFYYRRNRNGGYVEWTPVENQTLLWHPAENYYRKEISQECRVFNRFGADITSDSNLICDIFEQPGASSARVQIIVDNPDTSTYPLYSRLAGSVWYHIQGSESNRSTDINSEQGGMTRAQKYLYETANGFFPETTHVNVEIGDLAICSKPMHSTVTLGELLLDIVQSISAGGSDYEWNNTVTLHVTNTSSEDITVSYSPDNFVITQGQQQNFYTAATFTASALATTTYVINTGTFYTQFGLGMSSVCQGSITGVGDFTGLNYSAFDSDTEYLV
jgi:hypothetical protein